MNKINFPIEHTDLEINDINGVRPVNMSELMYVFNDFKDTSVFCKFHLKPKLGYMTWNEIYILNMMICYMKPEKVFEFGTFDGFSGSNIVFNNKDVLTKFTTLDISENDLMSSGFHVDNTNKPMVINPDKGKFLKEIKDFKNIEFILCDSAKFDTSQYKEMYDVVLVDACHTYDYVLNDTKKAYELCKPGGLIIWHDYNKNMYMPGVTTALNEFSIKENKQLYWINDRSISEYQTSLVFSFKE